MDRGYIAPATIVDGRVLVNHIISFVDGKLSGISPFDGEVANTAYINGIIIVADNRILDYLSDIESVAKCSVDDGVMLVATELNNYLNSKKWNETINKIEENKLLLYVNMEDGRVDILK